MTDNQRNSFLIIFGTMFVMAIFFAFAMFMTYQRYYNYGAATEQSLQATLDNNKNVLSATTLKVKEMAQVPDMYTADLQKIINANMNGRYGKDGQKAVVSFMSEHNLNLDSKMYLNIQNAMEAGRNEFKDNQTLLLDKKRSYETSLNSLFSGWMLHLAGYPKIDLKSIKIITAGEVDDKYTTGHDAVIKLR